MTSNGKVVEGTVIGRNGKTEEAQETVGKKFQQNLAEAIQKSLKLRRGEAKWGKPGSGEMEVRRQGILHRPNPVDQRRVEAAKTNTDRAILLGRHLIEVERFAAGGKKTVMECLQYVMEMDAEFPEELQPVGEELTEIIAAVVTGAFAEGLTMLGQRDLEEIERAFKPDER
jgi:hypothetical protein